MIKLMLIVSSLGLSVSAFAMSSEYIDIRIACANKGSVLGINGDGIGALCGHANSMADVDAVIACARRAVFESKTITSLGIGFLCSGIHY